MNPVAQFSEKELFEQLRTGDVNAFEMLFKNFYNPLCSYAFTILGDRDEAEDTVQRTMTRLWEGHRALDVQAGKAYLYTSVRNAAFNQIKHRKVRLKHVQEESHDASFSTITESTIPLQDRINEALQKLPTQCRVVFEMSRFEELKYAEIAEKLNISVKTVENQISKALKIMRAELKDYLPALIILQMLLNH